MAPETTHEELQELLGAYALDAVEQDERALIEAHLSDCHRCRTEVAEHLETAAMLAAAGAPAPDGIWDRIADQLEPEVVPIERARSRRRPTWIAAIAAAAVAAVLSVSVVRQQGQIEQLTAAAEGAAVVRAANLALLHPEARRATLESERPGIRAEAVMLPDGSGYLVDDTLEPAPEGRTYQLWSISGDRIVSAGVVGPDPDVTAFTAAPGTAVLAITQEVAGGVAQPSTDPLVTGDLVRA